MLHIFLCPLKYYRKQNQEAYTLHVSTPLIHYFSPLDADQGGNLVFPPAENIIDEKNHNPKMAPHWNPSVIAHIVYDFNVYSPKWIPSDLISKLYFASATNRYLP
eukprot:Sdes_comp19822_c0_seq4m11985